MVGLLASGVSFNGLVASFLWSVVLVVVVERNSPSQFQLAFLVNCVYILLRSWRDGIVMSSQAMWEETFQTTLIFILAFWIANSWK